MYINDNIYLHIHDFPMNLWGLDIFKLISYKNIQDIINSMDYKCGNWQSNWTIQRQCLIDCENRNTDR